MPRHTDAGCQRRRLALPAAVLFGGATVLAGCGLVRQVRTTLVRAAFHVPHLLLRFSCNVSSAMRLISFLAVHFAAQSVTRGSAARWQRALLFDSVSIFAGVHASISRYRHRRPAYGHWVCSIALGPVRAGRLNAFYRFLSFAVPWLLRPVSLRRNLPSDEQPGVPPLWWLIVGVHRLRLAMRTEKRKTVPSPAQAGWA